MPKLTPSFLRLGALPPKDVRCDYAVVSKERWKALSCSESKRHGDSSSNHSTLLHVLPEWILHCGAVHFMVPYRDWSVSSVIGMTPEHARRLVDQTPDLCLFSSRKADIAKVLCSAVEYYATRAYTREGTLRAFYEHFDKDKYEVKAASIVRKGPERIFIRQHCPTFGMSRESLGTAESAADIV